MKYTTASYSIELSKKIGVIPSIMVSVIDGFINDTSESVILSRKFIFDRTGIPIEAQKMVEDKLSTIGVISVKKVKNSSDKNYYCINYDCFDSLLFKQISEEPVETIKKDRKKMERATKKETTLKKLKGCVEIEDDVVKQYVFDWIDSVIESGNYLTQPSVKINIKQLTSACKTKEEMINVLLMATKNSWRDLGWAIDKLNISVDSDRNFANYSDIKFGEDDNLSDEVF